VNTLLLDDELALYPFYQHIMRQLRGVGYLAHKWGLTASLDAGHPYKHTVIEGTVSGDERQVACNWEAPQ